MALWFPVLFKLRREPQKAPYQVFVLDFQFADRQPIRSASYIHSVLGFTACMAEANKETSQPLPLYVGYRPGI